MASWIYFSNFYLLSIIYAHFWLQMQNSPFFTFSKQRLSVLASITAKYWASVGINCLLLTVFSGSTGRHRDRADHQLRNLSSGAALGPWLCRRTAASTQDQEQSFWFTCTISKNSKWYFSLKRENVPESWVTESFEMARIFLSPINISMPWLEKKNMPKGCNTQIYKSLFLMQWFVRALLRDSLLPFPPLWRQTPEQPRWRCSWRQKTVHHECEMAKASHGGSQNLYHRGQGEHEYMSCGFYGTLP